MTQTSPKPPPLIDCARVLEYAVLDETVTYSGHSSLFRDGKEVGPAPCLAICQDLSDSSVLLLHCSRDWTALGVTEYPTVSEARDRAERIYPGLSTRWIETHVTEQEVARYREEMWRDQECSFCGKRPDEVNSMIEKNTTRICDLCIAKFHHMMHECT